MIYLGCGIYRASQNYAYLHDNPRTMCHILEGHPVASELFCNEIYQSVHIEAGVVVVKTRDAS
jgi:hypothetical protein